MFVGCNKGIRVLNSVERPRLPQHASWTAPASFERNERSAVGDHFGWHPRTGPDVDQRDGHVFAGNLLVASETFAPARSLRFEQPQALCAQLARPQAKQVDGNVYVRYGGAAAPLAVYSPLPGESCQVEFGSLEELRQLQPGIEARGTSFLDYAGALFRSPELRRLELARALPGLKAADDLVPAEVRRLLGWPEKGTLAPGAFQARR